MQINKVTKFCGCQYICKLCGEADVGPIAELEAVIIANSSVIDLPSHCGEMLVIF